MIAVEEKPSDAAEATQLCGVCLRTLPLADFRRRRAGAEERDRRCNDCHNRQQRRDRAKKKARAIGKFATIVASEDTDDRRLVRLSVAALKRFGGPERLGSAMAEQARLAMQSKPGSSRALKYVLAIWRLVMTGQHRRGVIVASRRSKRDLNAMETNELAAELLAVLDDAASGAL
jgi:hypothetical protein